MRQPLLFLFCFGMLSVVSAQTRVFGKVTDRSGEALIGVTVREVGNRNNGTVTDVDGTFNLRIGSPEAKLLFSYVGMRDRTFDLASAIKRTNGEGEEFYFIEATLLESAVLVQEVVVTAYRGAQEERDLVGSYASVRTEVLEIDRPVESVDKLLEGRVAGVRVANVTGEPGLPVEVQIRGQGSLPSIGGRIGASTQPLFVLDGVPLFDVTETNTNNSVFSDINSQRLNPLAFLNPEDIESITVLKDASATALYGADAANGVVLITTKSAAADGRSRFSLSLNNGLAHTINEIQFLNTEEYLELARETLLNTGRNPADAGPDDVDTDWRSLVQRNARNTDLDLSYSAGHNDGPRFRLSAGYNELQSIHVGNGLRQLNVSMKVDAPIGERFEVGARVNGGSQTREGISTFDAFTFPPNLPVRRPDGSFNNDGFFVNRANPAAALEQNENESKSLALNGQLTFSYRPVNQLRFRLLAGFDRNDTRQFQYFSALNGSGGRRNGSLRLADRTNDQWVTNIQSTWSPNIGERHVLSLLAGGELNGQLNRQLVATGNDFPFDDLRRLAFLPAADTRVSESEFLRRKASAYGEIAYHYDYRYYLKINGRRDATSLFGGDRQAQLLWAFGTSWNLSEEDWWSSRPFGIDYAKLRFSYGVTGNSRLGVYTAQGLYRFASNTNYGGEFPLFVSAPINDFLGWERKRQLNLGLDLKFGPEERFSFTVEYYRNTTIDAITSQDVPYESGFATIVANAASIRNEGVELTLGYGSRPDAKWGYETDFNVARNRNELLSISLEDFPSANNPRAFRVGTDLGTLYGIPFVGVDPATGEEQWRTGEGEITTDASEVRGVNDFVAVGSATPDFFGGWSHRLRGGRVQLNLLLNFSYGAEQFVDRLTFQDGRQILFNNQSVNQLDRWRRPGDVTDTPRPRIDRNPVFGSTRYLFSISYLQLASLGVNYRFDLADRNFLGVKSLRLHALVNNVGYFYANDERRSNRNGVAEYRFQFPEQRAYVLGIKMDW